MANELHISNLSTSIYIQLSSHGEMSQKELASLFQKKTSSLNKSLSELKRRGFVMSFENSEKKELFKACSIMQIQEQADRYQSAVESLGEVVMKVQGDEELGIVKYEGWEGIRKVYLEVLEKAIDTKNAILALESGVDAEYLGKIFLSNYIKKRVESKVHAYVITPNTKKDKQYKEEYEGEYTSIKLIPDFKMLANINIVGDLVMSFSLNPPQGTLRRDKSEAETLKAMFNKIWNS